jgi:alpha-L-rhamnosidase
MGEIVSNWKVQNGLVEDITIPPNATAVVYLPAINVRHIKESGRPATKAKGVRFLRMENGYALFSVGSGTYQFVIPSHEFNADAGSITSFQHE